MCTCVSSRVSSRVCVFCLVVFARYPSLSLFWSRGELTQFNARLVQTCVCQCVCVRVSVLYVSVCVCVCVCVSTDTLWGDMRVVRLRGALMKPDKLCAQSEREREGERVLAPFIFTASAPNVLYSYVHLR